MSAVETAPINNLTIKSAINVCQFQL